MPAIFGYWNVRGLGHYIRFILEYTGEDYVEKIYGFGPAPEYSKSHWRRKKNRIYRTDSRTKIHSALKMAWK
ncbi:Glutathione S-transferase Mu 2 [Armadillidium nasatum]|uniref:Glutathione S-transferase Mu 2 n=1 Tax=Armadillidium nasatum TaxID=96803 RepID=A0A5N5T1E5_9CRUS|nr:Glutathione S-transferase Mu 2 [Armadillidium nasatum]